MTSTSKTTTTKKDKPKALTPLELGAIGHEAHRVYRASKNSEGNIPLFRDIPGEMQNAWAAAAQAVAQATAGHEVAAGPDPEWTNPQRAFLAETLKGIRHDLIKQAEADEDLAKKEDRKLPPRAARIGERLDLIDGCLAKLGAS